MCNSMHIMSKWDLLSFASRLRKAHGYSGYFCSSRRSPKIVGTLER